MSTDNSGYKVGQTLTLTTLSDEGDETESRLELKVKDIRQPFTLSCGLVVEVVKDSEDKLSKGSTVFLKLYDRRFAATLRKDYDAAAWTQSIEHEFFHFAEHGDAAKWLEDTITAQNEQSDRDSDSEDQKWNSAQRETYLTYRSAAIHNTELTAYKRLEEHQGKAIPKLLRSASLNSQDYSGGLKRRDVPVLDDLKAHDRAKLLEIRAIAIEFIDGFELSTLGEGKYAPKDKWPEIVSDAVDVVHILDDKNILNRDVRPGNFLVTPKKENSEAYEPRMIDFGLCRFRGEDESDAEWGADKWIQDEEGAIGYNMRSILRRVGFKLDFQHSGKFSDYVPGEDS